VGVGVVGHDALGFDKGADPVKVVNAQRAAGGQCGLARRL
jgi:hypothetical protein